MVSSLGGFFVIEGIDGAGCGAQRKAVAEKLRNAGFDVLDIKYPYYGSPVGEMIHDFLHEKVKLNVEMQFLLYAVNMIEDKERISENLKKGKIVLADRYFTSSLVYQSIRGFPTEKMLKFAEIFEMHIPKVVFLLNVPADIAMKRKIKEEGKDELDINERDVEFMKKIEKKYSEISGKNLFARWTIIDGTRSIDEISDEIVGNIKEMMR
jgi:dTMP kinase